MTHHLLMTDFGAVPVVGYVSQKDIPAWERCAKQKAQEAWEKGEQPEPLTIEDAMKMPEWHASQAITSMGYVYER